MSHRNPVPMDWEESDIAPHEAFALLADQNRFDIVRVIAEASRKPLSFNELYERSKFTDSGQFNYHLDKLVGPFLRKTEDGYRLRHAARIVYRLAVSGLLSDRGEAELTASIEPADDGWPAVDWVIRRACDHCQGWIYTRVHDLLRLHPAVISFYYERGVDVLGSTFWEAEDVMAEQTSVVTDTEEGTATARLAYDGDEIELRIAGDLRVSTIEVTATPTS